VLLSVVVPVYNQASSIAGNVRTILDRVGSAIDEPFELIVVSDGSVDGTEERLLATETGRVRVIHYDRNLGKGYAIKVGCLAARGRWISYIDSDLDLDPVSIPAFLDAARRESLDFAIGSKRHPDSIVHYPAARQATSWMYQQLVRMLFRLNVRDTQVGLKVFRREVVEQVVPLLLVKRYAFDLELLAVSRSLGFQRIRELPIALTYRFTGSGVRSVAVLRALIDTAAIFYRLRVLRYYQRKRRLLGLGPSRRALDYAPLVSVIAPSATRVDERDYARVEVVPLDNHSPPGRLAAAEQARGEILAFLGPDAVPAGNWLSSTLPFLADASVAAVVSPTMVPHRRSALHDAAAAVWESRLGGGSLRFRFTPGNIRFVRDFPSRHIVVRRSDFLEVASPELEAQRLCERLDAAGKRVVYTPETVVTTSGAPLFGPHLRAVAAYARDRGRQVREGGRAALRRSTVGPLALPAAVLLTIPLAVAGGWERLAWLAAMGVYLLALAVAGLGGAFRFRRWSIWPLTVLGLVATHLVYSVHFVSGFLRRGATAA
jgi:glycosyltransferase involved in cell wall biosynthesis